MSLKEYKIYSISCIVIMSCCGCCRRKVKNPEWFDEWCLIIDKTDLDDIQKATAKKRVGYIIKILETKKASLQTS